MEDSNTALLISMMFLAASFFADTKIDIFFLFLFSIAWIISAMLSMIFERKNHDIDRDIERIKMRIEKLKFEQMQTLIELLKRREKKRKR